MQMTEVLGSEATMDEIKDLIDRKGRVFVKPVFRGGIGKKGKSGLIGQADQRRRGPTRPRRTTSPAPATARRRPRSSAATSPTGIRGAEEFLPQVRAGELRTLAISSDERLPRSDAPTLKARGPDVSLVNRRGVFAPPGTRDRDKKAFSEALAKMVGSPGRKETLEKRGWLDMCQPATELSAFQKPGQDKVANTLRDIALVQ